MYMLDTDTASFIVRGKTEVLGRLKLHTLDHTCISAITKSELMFGLENKQQDMRYRSGVLHFLSYINVLDYSGEAASHYGDIRARLKERGQLIGANDLFIAAHARSMGMILVTNNTREFARVEGLRIENWMETV